jgi:peptidyl-tRNA hydrolase
MNRLQGFYRFLDDAESRQLETYRLAEQKELDNVFDQQGYQEALQAGKVTNQEDFYLMLSPDRQKRVDEVSELLDNRYYGMFEGWKARHEQPELALHRARKQEAQDMYDEWVKTGQYDQLPKRFAR